MNNESNKIKLESQVLQVPVEDIIPNRFQPRLSFDDKALEDLASSIKQHGIIQPLVLRRKNDKYEIIAGERRFKAAKIAGLLSVPAIISNLDDNASAEVAIVENVQRKSLTAIEEAKSYQMLLDKGYMTQEELAKKMGLSQGAISNKLRLLTLDEEVQKAVVNEQISERHARSLLKIPSHEKQKEILNKVINERMTVKKLEDYIKNELNINNNITKKEEEVMEDIKPVNAAPDINKVLNEAKDIKPIEIDTLDDSSITTVNSNAFFGSPEKVPNKFFNFLEDTAANMNLEEPNIEIKEEIKEEMPEDLLKKVDNIEMLDDFLVPNNTNNDYLDYVIKTIRDLNLDSDKVLIEEVNLPKEYQITIKIKKDKI